MRAFGQGTSFCTLSSPSPSRRSKLLRACQHPRCSALQSECTLQPCTSKPRGPSTETCGSGPPRQQTQGLSLHREKLPPIRPSLRLPMVPRYLLQDLSILPRQLGRTLFAFVRVFRLSPQSVPVETIVPDSSPRTSKHPRALRGKAGCDLCPASTALVCEFGVVGRLEPPRDGILEPLAT